MGRKKIEIRPLTDERNRNVTFLKRKAGLMKKAWELSVLCAADVSIVIFSAVGKAYEFSSKELDEQIERYYEYEGMIERRRAAEFAAMALAGEDDDDDDDENPRRGAGSKAKVGPNGQPAPTRSLKGKEVFKPRTVRAQSSRGEGRGREREREKRKRDKGGDRKGFIDGIVSESSETEEDDKRSRRRNGESQGYSSRKDPHAREESERSAVSHNKSLEGLQYALSMHASAPDAASERSRLRPPPPQQTDSYLASHTPLAVPQAPRLSSDTMPHRMSSTPTSAQVQTPGLPGMSSFTTQGDGAHGSRYYAPSYGLYMPRSSFQPPPSAPYYPSPYPQTSPGIQFPGQPPNFSPQPGQVTMGPNGAPIHWDQSLLAKYAEFQLQQSHQRQQRLLLEKQRQQLQELGVPLDEKSLLDDIFGGVGAARHGHGGGSSSASAIGEGRDDGNGVEFVWPLGNNVSMPGGEEDGPSPAPKHPTTSWGMEGFDGLDEMSGHGISLPSPVSAGAGDGRKMSGEEDALGKRTQRI
ncbi:hypothetical protein L202_01580 [Cryptococcus amylolentus CBS 6039]|uniref:MADS-box domain-containing protein n=1 Tax=Cryptococcus amylolentus CBS 6039 TaxID=1295533 RepID=A0A1E3I446_9TREE|nr:hypothetical protein L202_01580 [Cryptococcus amylolentus CBS 6039]ODN83440.1 hypothetical protein L202_01580 [Cryptococcus amylolentus CBS 6039]